MQKFLIVLGLCLMLGISANAQSPQEAKPSFDCAKATTKVEKMICEDSSGELQNLDRQISQSYQDTKAKLDKNAKKALLDSQKSWLKTRERCESKECLKESLQSRIKELQSYTPHTSNAWLGTYSLQENLYTGSFTIQKCKNNTCEASYFALLHKSEFNDMHQCDISLKLQIKSQQEAIAYFDDEDFINCKIYIKKNPQGIVFTRDEKAFDSPDSFCSTMCGNQTIFEWGDMYKKEVQEWSGTYNFSENVDSQNIDLSKSRQQIFRFLDCNNEGCLAEYESLYKYATCEIRKDDRILSLKILSPKEAILQLKIKDGHNVEKICELTLQKTQKGFRVENPLNAIESCNTGLSIFETCGAETNPDWTMEFIKEQ